MVTPLLLLGRNGGPIPVNECALVEALGPGDVAGDWALAADDSFTHVVAMTVLTAYKIDKVSHASQGSCIPWLKPAGQRRLSKSQGW